jgi:hypothetical protein
MCVKLVRCVDHTPGIAADADRHRPVNLRFCRRGPAATIRTVVSGVPAAPSCAIKGNLDRLTEAATGGRDDRGDADVSGDTDRDPEADAPRAYRGTS